MLPYVSFTYLLKISNLQNIRLQLVNNNYNTRIIFSRVVSNIVIPYEMDFKF